MRLDKFLKNVGVVPRRSLAQEACRRGLVLLDGRPAKPSAFVQPGQELVVKLGMAERRYLVLQVPQRPVARAMRERCIRLVESRQVSIEEILRGDEGEEGPGE